MRRKLWIIFVFVLSLNGLYTYADEGELGFFGGVSEGTNLPRTIDQFVAQKATTRRVLTYKEVIFISGEPVVFEGTIDITKNDSAIATKESGSYTEKYVVDATNLEKNATLKRNLQLTTSFRKVEQDFKTQITRSSTVSKWDETITIDGVTYRLDSKSNFYKTSVEDITPGINYYNTVVTYNASYTSSNNDKILVQADNNIYGFSQHYSKIESQKMNQLIDFSGPNNQWQMEVAISPSVEAKKTLYYDQATPYAISFAGTYNQRLERDANLTYSIVTHHPNLTEQQKRNSVAILTPNQIEKLLIPKGLEFLNGHWGEEDIKQLYAQEIFTSTPHTNMRFEAMTRGEYIKALSLAVSLDTSKYFNTRTKKIQVFDDVPTNHPLYPYIMTAYDAKLTKGHGNTFGVDTPITREEAFVIFIRVIGLERLGITNQPQTPFVDDAKISSWAKKEIMAGYNLGIIKGDDKGQVLPKQHISKVEAGAIINRLVNYLRFELAEHYKS